MEDRMDSRCFVRISNSEIINTLDPRKIAGFR